MTSKPGRNSTPCPGVSISAACCNSWGSKQKVYLLTRVAAGRTRSMLKYLLARNYIGNLPRHLKRRFRTSRSHIYRYLIIVFLQRFPFVCAQIFRKGPVKRTLFLTPIFIYFSGFLCQFSNTTEWPQEVPALP